MPATMNISLPDDLRAFVDEQVRERAFGSTSEYVRDLIRKQRDVEKLRSLLREGLESGPPAPVTEAWFDGMRRRARTQARKGR